MNSLKAEKGKEESAGLLRIQTEQNLSGNRSRPVLASCRYSHFLQTTFLCFVAVYACILVCTFSTTNFTPVALLSPRRLIPAPLLTGRVGADAAGEGLWERGRPLWWRWRRGMYVAMASSLSLSPQTTVERQFLSCLSRPFQRRYRGTRHTARAASC